MQRRRVLQMGAVLAALPIAGCGQTAPAAPAAPVRKSRPEEREPARGAPEPGGAAAPPADPGVAASSPDAGGGDAGAPAPPGPSLSRVVGRLGKNHGHALVVAFADVRAGVERTYDVAGTAGHPHSVTLSADHMTRLLGGAVVRTTSTTDRGHAHRVVVRCAPPVDPPEWVSVCEVKFSGKDEHEIVIPADDLAAGVDRTYDVQGIAGHTHELTITGADFEKLSRGGPVTLQTSREPFDAHLHVVSIERRRGSSRGERARPG